MKVYHQNVNYLNYDIVCCLTRILSNFIQYFVHILYVEIKCHYTEKRALLKELTFDMNFINNIF